MAITYPVSPDSKWSVYQLSTQQVIASHKPWAVADGSEIVGLDADYVYLLEITEAKPTYDSATHKLVKDAVNYDTINNTATTSWSAVALSAEEIAERTPAHYETSTGIKMATDLQSQAAFSNMMTLLNEAGMADTEMVMIKDCFGASHGMTLAEFRTQAVAFGLHCYSQFHSS
jgi:hypothetical protein